MITIDFLFPFIQHNSMLALYWFIGIPHTSAVTVSPITGPATCAAAGK